MTLSKKSAKFWKKKNQQGCQLLYIQTGEKGKTARLEESKKSCFVR
jgi:hypothetical protein